MIEYSNTLGGGGSSTATLPDQITNLACTGGTDGSHGTIDVSFTEVPATSFDLLKYYILIYKAGGIPQTPFDGTRITLPKGTAGAKLEHQITGLTFDQLYGVRVYPVSVKNQFQTLTEGATATVTPVNGIDLGSLSIADRYAIPVLEPYQTRFGNEIVFKIADKNHTGYPSGAVTLITDRIVALLPFDAKEPSNSNSDRQNYGNNRYSYANLLQWLNSNATAGNWYSAKHAADASPASARVSVNPYNTWAGLLAMLDDNFVAALMNTTQTVVLNTVTDGGSYETVTSKMFLASTTEVGLANENSIAEGSKLALFSDDTSRLAYCTQAAIDTSQYTSDPTTSAAWYYWLRTPSASSSRSMRFVNTSGALNNSGAFFGHNGVRPLCNLLSNSKVKPEPRADGIYEPVWA